MTKNSAPQPEQTLTLAGQTSPAGGVTGKDTLILILLLLLGMVLRFFQISERSLWLDEATSFDVATKSVADILAGVDFNRHTPPVYYLLLHFWLRMFPLTELGLRSFSALLDGLNIALLYLIAFRLFDRTAAFRATLFFCFSAYAVYYSQEGRMYTLTLCEVLLTFYLSLRYFTRGRTGSLVLLLPVVVLGLYTHYYYALALAAIGIAFTVRYARSRPGAWFRWAGTLGVAGLCFLPWLGVIQGLVQSEGQDFRRFVFSVLPYTFFRFVAGYGVMPLNAGSKDDMVATATAFLPELLLYFGTFGAAFIVALLRHYRAGQRDTLTLLMIPLVVPALLALLISLFTPMLSERYLIVSFPFFALLLFSAPRSAKGPSIDLLTGCMALLTLFALQRHYFNPNFGNEQWHEAAAYIRESPAQPIVYVNPEYCVTTLGFYLPPELRPRRWPDDGLPTAGTEVYLVERGEVASGRKAFEENGWKLVEEKFYPLENGLLVSRLQK